MARRLGEMLIKEGLITENQLHKGLAAQKKHGGKLGNCLVSLGYLSEDQLLTGISRQLGVARIDLTGFDVESDIIKLISPETAYKYKVIPIAREGKKGLTVAMSDPTNMFAIDDIQFRTGFNVTTLVASEKSLEKALSRYYPSPEAISKLSVTTETDIQVVVLDPLAEVQSQSSDDPPAISFLNSILLDAVQKGARSLHIEPYEQKLRVRVRIDGVLHEQVHPPIRMRNAILSQIESIFSFDRAGRHRPQSGYVTVKIDEHQVRMMAQTYPTFFGEKIVIKLWDQSGLNLEISQLGLQQKAFNDLSKAINGHYGMILFAGPRKNEKMMTYYSILNAANTTRKNVISIEDPIEYNLDGINQVEVAAKGNWTYASALQFLMEGDADIIGLSDVSDSKVFKMANRLATYRRVYGLIGSRGTVDALTQLLNEQIDTKLMAETLKCVVTQTSMRKICEHCKTPTEIKEEKFARFGLDSQKLAGRTYYIGKGCDNCFGTGYRFCQPIFEIMSISPALAEMIARRAPSNDIRTEAIKEGMRPIKEDALLKFVRGITTLDEVAKEFT